MNKNLLYVGNNVDNVDSGQAVANRQNINVLKTLFEDNFFLEEVSNPNFLDKVFLYTGGLTPHIVERVILRIKESKIDIVFLSSSALGKLAKIIKQKFSNVVIICFYHNIEKYYAMEQLRVSGLKKLPTFLTLSYNEYMSSKYCDCHVVLNKRDSLLLEKYYKRSANLIVPISYIDNFDVNRCFKTNDSNISLFVGSSFFANIEGLKWYISKVKPFTSDRLIIVGKGMENYKNDFSCDNVEVHGYVDDLSDFYYRANFVVLPIFSGGGMKTKTAEAFMYGKKVFGTSEAFEGYEDLDSNFAVVCNDADSYIESISNLLSQNKRESYNYLARNYFLHHNSFDAVLVKWKSFFDKIL